MYANNTGSLSGTPTFTYAMARLEVHPKAYMASTIKARGAKGWKRILPDDLRGELLEGLVDLAKASATATSTVICALGASPANDSAQAPTPPRRVPQRLQQAAQDRAAATPVVEAQATAASALDLPAVSLAGAAQPPAGTSIADIFGDTPVPSQATPQAPQQPPVQQQPPTSQLQFPRTERKPVPYGKVFLDGDMFHEAMDAINEKFVMHTGPKGLRAYDVAKEAPAGFKPRDSFVTHVREHVWPAGIRTVNSAGTKLVVLGQDGKEMKGDDGESMGIPVAAGEVWWQVSRIQGKRVVDRIVMEPTHLTSAQDSDRRPEVFNRWHLLKHTRCPPSSDVEAARQGCQMLYDHLLYLAGGDKVPVLFAFNWLAELWQHPGIKMPTALYFLSEFTGTGKSMLARLFRAVFGEPLVANLEGSKLERDFDDAIIGKQLVFVHEVSGRRAYDKLKHQISELYTVVEGKGVAATEALNTQHFIFTGNRLDGLPAMREDRRLVVFLCRERAKSADYYSRINAWIDSDGPSHLAWLLGSWQFPEDWNPHAPAPQTNAAREVQRAARGELANSIEEMILERRPPFNRDLGRIREMIPTLRMVYPDLNENRLADILKVLGHEQIRCGTSGATNPLYRYWPFRNDSYWTNKPNAVLKDHLEKGTVPFDYPNDQGE